MKLAKHIIGLHTENMEIEENDKNEGNIDFDLLKKYIAYARAEV